MASLHAIPIVLSAANRGQLQGRERRRKTGQAARSIAVSIFTNRHTATAAHTQVAALAERACSATLPCAKIGPRRRKTE
jgi:hypothetical protein